MQQLLLTVVALTLTLPVVESSMAICFTQYLSTAVSTILIFHKLV